VPRVRVPGPMSRDYIHVKVTRELLEKLCGVLAEVGTVVIFSGKYYCDTIDDVIAAPPSERYPIRLAAKDAKGSSHFTIDVDKRFFRVFSYNDDHADHERFTRINFLVESSAWDEACEFERKRNGPIPQIYGAVAGIGFAFFLLGLTQIDEFKRVGVDPLSVVMIPLFLSCTALLLSLYRQRWFWKHLRDMPNNLLRLTDSELAWQAPKTITTKIVWVAITGVAGAWAFVFSYILPLFRSSP
jgi:hypothetical protein